MERNQVKRENLGIWLSDIFFLLSTYLLAEHAEK